VLASAEELRGAARALRSTQSLVEGDRSSLERAGSIFNSWRSPAADDMKATLYPMCLNSLGSVIRDLSDLATMLDRSADELDNQLQRIRSIESNVRNWFANQVVPADGEQPRWISEWWKYRPGRLPTSGDSEWFDAGTYLRNRGVAT
jgi:hypothetical protein